MSADPQEMVAAIGAPPVAGGDSRRTARRRFGVMFWLSVAWLGLVVFAAIFADALPLLPPKKTLAAEPLIGPSMDNPFGTDLLGHDLFSRVVHGARVSMIVAGTSLAIGLLIGGSLGVAAGFFRRRTDAVILWVTDVMLTFPALVLALALVSFAGRSFRSVLLAIAILSLPAYTRIARANTLSFAEREFVMAARMLGAKSSRIMFREIAPHVFIGLLSYAALGASVAIIAEGALAFLGLSVPGSLSWGSMIAEGQSQLRDAPQAAFAPAAVMFFTILALNLVGERLGTAIDPRSRQL